MLRNTEGPCSEVPAPSPADFAKRMAAIRALAEGDPEMAQSRADDLIIETLTALGYDCTDYDEMKR